MVAGGATLRSIIFVTVLIMVLLGIGIAHFMLSYGRELTRTSCEVRPAVTRRLMTVALAPGLNRLTKMHGLAPDFS